MPPKHICSLRSWSLLTRKFWHFYPIFLSKNIYVRGALVSVCDVESLSPWASKKVLHEIRNFPWKHFTALRICKCKEMSLFLLMVWSNARRDLIYIATTFTLTFLLYGCLVSELTNLLHSRNILYSNANWSIICVVGKKLNRHKAAWPDPFYEYPNWLLHLLKLSLGEP